MKTIFINGIETAVDSEQMQLSNLIKNLNQSNASQNQFVSSVVVNGKELSEADQNDVLPRTIGEFESIEVVISNPSTLALETLNTLETYLVKLSDNFKETARAYQDRNLLQADQLFMRAVDGLDLFVQTITGVKGAIRLGLNSKLAIAEATLLSIMNDLLEAKRQNNYTLLSELLSTDLTENFAEWREQVFPLFRDKVQS